MSLASAFKIGFLNAWLLVLPLIGNLILQARVAGIREKGEKSSLDYLTAKEKNILFLMQAIISLSYVYSIFLPLRLDTVWFYVGFFVYLVGLSFSSQGILQFANSSKDSLVTDGLYRFSRHPMYVGWLLVYVGIGIACMSWLYLSLLTLLMMLVHILVKAEECWCLEKYGDVYREYMKKTPKWLVRQDTDYFSQILPVLTECVGSSIAILGGIITLFIWSLFEHNFLKPTRILSETV